MMTGPRPPPSPRRGGVLSFLHTVRRAAATALRRALAPRAPRLRWSQAAAYGFDGILWGRRAGAVRQVEYAQGAGFFFGVACLLRRRRAPWLACDCSCASRTRAPRANSQTGKMPLGWRRGASARKSGAGQRISGARQLGPAHACKLIIATGVAGIRGRRRRLNGRAPEAAVRGRNFANTASSHPCSGSQQSTSPSIDTILDREAGFTLAGAPRGGRSGAPSARGSPRSSPTASCSPRSPGIRSTLRALLPRRAGPRR